jgi:pimeloyl-ACP methyl ester carboxylesterase
MENGVRIYRHGTSGPAVVALHGGPADVGGAAPIARGLADSFRVVEPWQRGSGEIPLSVAVHVDDLHELILAEEEARPPAIVGHSWGAMLALAYAAAHPDDAGPIVLVGSGTFDAASRERMYAINAERTDDELREKLRQLEIDCPDPARRQIRKHELSRKLYTYDDTGMERDPALPEPFDKQAHGETWSDMMRLQAERIYPAAFAAIRSPVLMLHGDYDPHPGEMIRDSLLPFIPQLEYHELEKCGHYPWEERYAREEFFEVLRGWLVFRCQGSTVNG